ncbi:MAG: hypothetical protein ABJY83_13720 [Roseibium sp.]
MIKTEKYTSGPVGMLPNSRFPLLIHRSGIPGGVDAVLARFRECGWLNNWQNAGVWDYGHFHSTTHECLGCASGWMDVQVFGDNGPVVRIEAGDVIVMPAGVSHAMTGCSDDVLIVGGYPDGRDWDNLRQDHMSDADRIAAVKRIMMLPIPSKDPVSGDPIHEWIEAPSSGDAGLDDYRLALDSA